MKKMFVLGMCLALVNSVQAQFQFYKVENGTKTLLKASEEVVIAMDDNLKPTSNLLLEVNVPEFKKKFTYNLFTIVLKRMGVSSAVLLRAPLVFDSEYYTSKYGTDKIIRYYLFPDQSPTKDFKAFVYYEGKDWYDKFAYENTLDTLSFEMSGAYKTGSEAYYENGTVKNRDLFSDAEFHAIPGVPVVRFTTSDKLKADYQRSLDEKRYQKTIVDPGYSQYFQQNSTYSITLYGIAEQMEAERKKAASYQVFGEQLYPQIVKSYDEITAYRTEQIKAETDMYKALAMLDAWASDAQKMMIVEKLTEEQRKLLNKQLKTAPDAAAKFQLFMTFQ